MTTPNAPRLSDATIVCERNGTRRFAYDRARLETGIVVLYINNRIVHRKNHVTIKLSVPTHFVIAEKIEIEDDKITLVYWDYGRKTLLQMSPAFFKRIVFGVTHCTKKENNAD